MTDEPDSPPARPDSADPLARLWKRYGRARGAKLGLVMVAAFTLLAFLAPFLAHRLPLFWYDQTTGAKSWPLIREFFSPTDTTEAALETGINFLFVFIPLALLAWHLMNKHLPELGKSESRLISLFFGFLCAASLWLSVGGMVIEGGGKDWLYYETAPVPEIDDIENLGALAAPPPADPVGKAAREAVDRRLADLLPPGEDIAGVDAKVDDETRKRRLILPLQDAVDGPAMAGVDAIAALGPMDTHGLTDADVTSGVDRARWNRLLMEKAYPGLLHPMRQFRSAFITMLVLCLLTLLGLSYIFLAGSYQFALTPRWLLLAGLAVFVALPFRAGGRHDYTDYRRLAEEGKGWGVFPIIPYGPNEQGFGPRLPPTWYTESAYLTNESVRSWRNLRDELANPGNPLAAGVAAELARAFPESGPPEALDGADGRERLLAALNERVRAGDFYDPAQVQESYRRDTALLSYLKPLREGKELDVRHRERMNRILLQKAFPQSLLPVADSRWKKPQHTEGNHVLGTDESGRDVLVRIIHGARVSLSVGFVSVFLATIIGLVLGSLAAYYGGRIDMLISRFMEIMMCFPSFFLILAVIAVLDKRSIVNIMLVIGLTSWTGVARLIRGEMLRQKKMEYVAASIALGASDTRTIFRQILPNAMAPVLVSISFGITGAILTEASLSFIGFGVTPPTPTWGQLLSETRESPLANWWLALFPGIVLFLSVLAYNMVGEALRDALDPRTTL